MAGTFKAGDRAAYSVEETARLIGIGRATLWQLIREGQGPATLRIGRRRLVRRVALEEWLARRESSA